MAPGDGWYLFGPLFAVGLVAILGFVFWRLGLHWIEQADDGMYSPDGRLSIFGDPPPELDEEFDDFGLLRAAAVAADPEQADEIRLLLAGAGIRATAGVRHDGSVAVLVFAEELEAAHRLML